MNIQFKLRGTGKREPKIILFLYDPRFNDRKFVYSTSLSISEKNWDKRRDRPKQIPGSSNEYDMINISKRLDLIAEKVKVFLSLRYNEVHLSKSELNAHLNDTLEVQSNSKTMDKTFYDIWENLISTTKNPKTGNLITSGTKRSKKQTLELLKEYFRVKKIEASFNSFDIEFYHSFDEFMREKSLNDNTRGKHFKEVKAILREAEDRDISVNRAYLKKSFKVIRTNPDNVYLNDDEIKNIYELELTPGQSRQRDIFVMACYVGARHSDWSQINKNNIIEERGKEMLRIKQTKTGEITHIPIHSAVKAVLNKYNGFPPKIIANQKFNEALKAICGKVELGMVKIGNDHVKKSDMITTHTARRSFATNAYLSRSLDVYQIMRCTGHKSESSFLRYLKLDGKDFAIQAADSKFFNDNAWTSLKVAS